ncbi:hypothetical protein BT96DRAFT_915307, partial [Gymnopus androsaceus JB14]
EVFCDQLTKPIIASGHERLTARSVKIFADGERLSIHTVPHRRRLRLYFLGQVLFGQEVLHYTSLMQ